MELIGGILGLLLTLAITWLMVTLFALPFLHTLVVVIALDLYTHISDLERHNQRRDNS